LGGEGHCKWRKCRGLWRLFNFSTVLCVISHHKMRENTQKWAPGLSLIVCEE
jgi:hypothetical protein